jgi:hypothetical protein
MKRKITIFWTLCYLLLLSGCTVQFLYNRLDWLIPWYIGDFIDLTQEQSEALDHELAEQLRWHRMTQLPAYAKSIYRLSTDVRDGFSRVELDQHYASLETHWNTLVHRLAPEAAALLITISDRQVQDLIDEMDDKHKEFQDKYVDPPEAERRLERAERVSELVRDWLGSINAAQQKAVHDWSQRYRLTGLAILQHRRAWQARLRDLLARRHDVEKFNQALESLIAYPQRDWSEDYRRRLEVNRELSKDLILELDRQTTPAQRTHLERKLNGLAHDFRELASAS